MKSNQPQPDNESESTQHPWAAIAVGGFLILCGIGASVYSYIAITWTAESTSEVISIDSPTSSASPASEQADAANLDPDEPIRTSTTRRRTTPSETRRPSVTATTASQEENNSSKSTSSDSNTTSDDDDASDSEDDNSASNDDESNSAENGPSEDVDQSVEEPSEPEADIDGPSTNQPAD